jgi:hypothetical protein
MIHEHLILKHLWFAAPFVAIVCRCHRFPASIHAAHVHTTYRDRLVSAAINGTVTPAGHPVPVMIAGLFSDAVIILYSVVGHDGR